MPVYVDPNLPWPPGPTWLFNSVSHMYADTPEELHAMAATIGLHWHWCSDFTQPDDKLLHYDLNKTRRAAAVKAGAIKTTHAHMIQYKNRAEGKEDGEQENESHATAAGSTESGAVRAMQPATQKRLSIILKPDCSQWCIQCTSMS